MKIAPRKMTDREIMTRLLAGETLGQFSLQSGDRVSAISLRDDGMIWDSDGWSQFTFSHVLHAPISDQDT